MIDISVIYFYLSFEIYNLITYKGILFLAFVLNTLNKLLLKLGFFLNNYFNNN